jgi:hypothetical protein
VLGASSIKIEREDRSDLVDQFRTSALEIPVSNQTHSIEAPPRHLQVQRLRRQYEDLVNIPFLLSGDTPEFCYCLLHQKLQLLQVRLCAVCGDGVLV